MKSTLFSLNKYFVLFCLLVISNNLFSQQDYYAAALAEKQNKNYTQAINNINKALETNTDNATYNLLKAELLFLKKDAIVGVPFLQKLIANSAFSNKPELRLYLAKLFTHHSQVSKAAEVLLLISNKDLIDFLVEDQIYIYNTLGAAEQKNNIVPKAIAWYNKSLALNKNQKDIYIKLAECHSITGNHKLSCDYYCSSLALDSTLGFAYLQACNSCINADNYKLAESILLQAKRAGMPEDLTYLRYLANVYYDSKQYKKAIEVLLKAKVLSPYDIGITNQLVYAYYYNTDNKNARAQLEQLINQFPDEGDYVYILGMTYRNDGDNNKANYLFELAIKMKPELGKLKTGFPSFTN
jgi:tetratricopeptide (TPR) repeat protein